MSKLLSNYSKRIIFERLIIGVQEPIMIKGIGTLNAKVDSGNGGYNVIHGTDFTMQGNILTFLTQDNDGNPHRLSKQVIDTLNVNIGGGHIQERPVINLTVKFAGDEYKDIPFSVTDRSDNKDKVLISKEFVKNELEALIDVGEENLTNASDSSKEEDEEWLTEGLINGTKRLAKGAVTNKVSKGIGNFMTRFNELGKSIKAFSEGDFGQIGKFLSSLKTVKKEVVNVAKKAASAKTVVNNDKQLFSNQGISPDKLKEVIKEALGTYIDDNEITCTIDKKQIDEVDSKSVSEKCEIIKLCDFNGGGPGGDAHTPEMNMKLMQGSEQFNVAYFDKLSKQLEKFGSYNGKNDTIKTKVASDNTQLNASYNIISRIQDMQALYEASINPDEDEKYNQLAKKGKMDPQRDAAVKDLIEKINAEKKKMDRSKFYALYATFFAIKTDAKKIDLKGKTADFTIEKLDTNQLTAEISKLNDSIIRSNSSNTENTLESFSNCVNQCKNVNIRYNPKDTAICGFYFYGSGDTSTRRLEMFDEPVFIKQINEKLILLLQKKGRETELERQKEEKKKEREEAQRKAAEEKENKDKEDAAKLETENKIKDQNLQKKINAIAREYADAYDKNSQEGENEKKNILKKLDNSKNYYNRVKAVLQELNPDYAKDLADLVNNRTRQRKAFS